MATRSVRSSSLLAFVLHRYDWSESSLILDLFTREEGRLAVAAKGAKRPYSQLRSVLLPFQRINVGLSRGAGADPAIEVQNLRAAEWAGGRAMLSGAALFSGFYLNELLMKLVARHDPHQALFDAYAETLGTLAEAVDPKSEAALRAFELTLLREIGVLPDLSIATQTQRPVVAGARYGLLAESGVGAVGDDEAGLDGTTLVGVQAALEHGSQPALQQACSVALPELKGLLRAQLHYHLGSSVLRTRQVMVEAQNLEY
ncbi:MAG: DNA repair protein RecO [Pseudomonadota bacterium]|nr:DNA repair protein RecO [Pseudomonadota bacterium]